MKDPVIRPYKVGSKCSRGGGGWGANGHFIPALYWLISITLRPILNTSNTDDLQFKE